MQMRCQDATPSVAAIAGFLYITPVSGATFLLDQRLVDFDTAESFCNTQGGHLAYYTSLEEQEDVETYFLAQVGPAWRSGAACCMLGRGASARGCVCQDKGLTSLPRPATVCRAS